MDGSDQRLLDGVLVIELGRYISAPFASKLLADLGAEVVKVEDPRGDPMRQWTPRSSENPETQLSPSFTAYNAGKRSIVADLKLGTDRERFYRLVERADVVLDNFRPGVTRRLGIDWDDLHARNPRLIYCSITGFGTSGPYVDLPVYDSVASAMSGLFSLIVDTQQQPHLAGPAFSDLIAGMFAAQGILAALYEQSRTGRGQRIDVSMLGATLGFLTESAQAWLDSGEVVGPDTRVKRGGAHLLFGEDGLPFVVHLSVPEQFWIGLTDAFGVPELRESELFSRRDARHAHHYELNQILKERARGMPRAAWLDILRDKGVPHAAFNTVAEALSDEQVRRSGIVTELTDPLGPSTRHVASPVVQASRGSGQSTVRAPLHGEHTDQYLGIQP